MAETFPATLDPVRDLFASDAFRRRAISYGLAFALHAVALVALLTLPPAIMREAERVGQALDIRFYTVAGGEDAETDAPLFEPPLAGGQAGAGPVGVDGGQSGEDAGTAEAEAPVAATEPEPEAIAEPEPVDIPVPEVETLPEPGPATDATSPDATIIQTEPEQAAAAPPTTQRVPDVALEPAIDPRRTDAPIATAQPGEAVPEAARPAAPVSFADIVARAQSRLDPEDFRILANFAGGVTGTVRENFCLSSSDANQEAFDCPEGSQLAASRLAQYGLMGLGEEPPEFLEDMDRLAFQLSQTGAGDSAIERILVSVREARRDAINRPDLTRQMQRDARNQTDHMGVSNPFGDDGP